MTLQGEWVRKIKEGDVVGLLGGDSLQPIIFKSWNGQSAYCGHRAQYYWIPSNQWSEWTQKDWDRRFKSLEDPDSWIHHTSSVNSRAELRFTPYPVEFLCKNQKKFIKQFKHLKGYEY
jgi:hypothetical protein|tara:strand:+ start:1526 stop:1879 length:354 start_codon:yes stop_codon:yes gene_type:complete